MSHLIEGRDFVVTGLQPWDTAIGSNAKDIAVEISRHNRVLYVDTPLDMLTYRKGEDSADFRSRARAVREGKPIVRQVNRNLWVVDLPVLMFPSNGIPFTPLFKLFNRLNNRRISGSLRPVLRDLGFENFVLFTDNDIYRGLYLPEMLRPACSVYYRRDYLLGVDYWRKYGTLLEPQIARNYDLVVANSQYLADGVAAYNPHSYDVGQGVDLSNLNPETQGDLPANIVGISRPIVGYVGALLSLRLDIELLCEVAKRLTECSFVFVGPEDEAFRVSELHTLPNVYFLGQQPVERVPDYIRAFDICINPQVVRDVTVGNYPRKVDEYLAIGKPVVAVRTPAMQMFADYVWLIDDADEFVVAVRRILETNGGSDEDAEQRMAFAREHTWANSVGKMYYYINKVINDEACRDKK